MTGHRARQLEQATVIAQLIRTPRREVAAAARERGVCVVRELLEQYDLFFIDTSYGRKQATIDNTAEHIKGYLTENFEVSGHMSKDLLGLAAEQVLITDYSLASDENVISFAKEKGYR